jgi:hypothetical protein
LNAWRNLIRIESPNFRAATLHELVETSLGLGHPKNVQAQPNANRDETKPDSFPDCISAIPFRCDVN